VARWHEGFRHNLCAGYTFHVTERKRILKEYMEVKEEGKRKLTGRCMLGRQLHEGVVAGARSSRSGRGRRRRRAAPRAGDHQAFLHASPAPPAGERRGRATLVVRVGGRPRGPAELHGQRAATTMSPRARPASGAHPRPWRCGRGYE
jgi:hypothetical protein